MVEVLGWSPARRIAFRFGALLALLLIFPFPFGFVPYTGPLHAALTAPLDWAIAIVAEYVLGIDPPPHVVTGSGDTLWHHVRLLSLVMIAGIATIAWSVIARRQAAHGRLQGAVIVVLRYYVATVMLGYGLAKLFVVQMPPVSLARADQTIGEMSPMGMLWTFMGASPAYTIFTGAVEVLGSVLLLLRRTAVIGALVTAAAMTNVVVLNFTYDVPVKLFSMQLLAFALAIALPQLRRLGAAALGRAVPEVPPRVRGTGRVERLRLACKLGFLALYAASAVFYAEIAGARARPRSPLHGVWVVERFVFDGHERAPLLTDDARWRKLIVTEHGVQIRYMTDRRERFASAQVDPETRSIIIPDGVRRRTWHYEQPDPTHLVLRGEHFEATLALEPAPLLLSRGFRWIQEAPFNR